MYSYLTDVCTDITNPNIISPSPDSAKYDIGRFMTILEALKRTGLDVVKLKWALPKFLGLSRNTNSTIILSAESRRSIE